MTRQRDTSHSDTHRPTGPSGHRVTQEGPPPGRRLRTIAFTAIALSVSALALALVVGRLLPPAATDVTAVQVHASMGGFDPPALTVKAGQTVRVEFSSMDTAFHSDGGGWHQFAIDELDLDWQVGPESSEVFEFTAPATPGAYAFYCDICCGGKENPSMQGELTVTV